MPSSTPSASDQAPGDDAAKRTYYGRNGSPEITVAFPFAKVEVTRADEALRASVVAALHSMDRLAELSISLANATSDEERAVAVNELGALRAELEHILNEVAATTDR